MPHTQNVPLLVLEKVLDKSHPFSKDAVLARLVKGYRNYRTVSHLNVGWANWHEAALQRVIHHRKEQLISITISDCDLALFECLSEVCEIPQFEKLTLHNCSFLGSEAGSTLHVSSQVATSNRNHPTARLISAAGVASTSDSDSASSDGSTSFLSSHEPNQDQSVASPSPRVQLWACLRELDLSGTKRAGPLLNLLIQCDSPFSQETTQPEAATAPAIAASITTPSDCLPGSIINSNQGGGEQHPSSTDTDRQVDAIQPHVTTPSAPLKVHLKWYPWKALNFFGYRPAAEMRLVQGQAQQQDRLTRQFVVQQRSSKQGPHITQQQQDLPSSNQHQTSLQAPYTNLAAAVDESGAGPSARLPAKIQPAFPKLRSLSLAGCADLEDTCLQCLSRLTSLHSLNLSGCTCLDELGFSHVAGMTWLHSLDLSHCHQINLRLFRIIFNKKACPKLPLGQLARSEPGTRPGAPQGLTSLRSLSVAHFSTNRYMLLFLPFMPALTHLDLSGYDGAACITGPVALRSLVLQSTQSPYLFQSDAFNRNALTELDLSDCSWVTSNTFWLLIHGNTSLCRFRFLSHSRPLHLSTWIFDLATCTNLTHLEMMLHPSTDHEILAPLTSLSKLQHVRLETRDTLTSNVDDAGLLLSQVLSTFWSSGPGLTTLSLFSDPASQGFPLHVDASGIAMLSAFTTLQKLGMPGRSIPPPDPWLEAATGAGAFYTAHAWPALTQPAAPAQQNSQQGLELEGFGASVGALQQLQQLQLWDVAARSMQELLQYLPDLVTLQSLCLRSGRHIGLEAFSAIAQLPKLQDLSLAHCREVRVSGLSQLSSVSRLVRLDLSHCSGDMNSSVWCALGTLTSLTYLSLEGCPGVNMAERADQLQHASNLLQLQVLNCSHCTRASESSARVRRPRGRCDWSFLTLMTGLTQLEFDANFIEQADLARLSNLQLLRQLSMRECVVEQEQEEQENLDMWVRTQLSGVRNLAFSFSRA